MSPTLGIDLHIFTKCSRTQLIDDMVCFATVLSTPRDRTSQYLIRAHVQNWPCCASILRFVDHI